MIFDARTISLECFSPIDYRSRVSVSWTNLAHTFVPPKSSLKVLSYCLFVICYCLMPVPPLSVSHCDLWICILALFESNHPTRLSSSSDCLPSKNRLCNSKVSDRDKSPSLPYTFCITYERFYVTWAKFSIELNNSTLLHYYFQTLNKINW